MKFLSAFTPVALAGCLLALVLAGGASSAFPGTNGSIVFASDRDGALDVYVMSANGTPQIRLTDADGDDVYPMWSHDGTKLVFSSWREGNSKIFKMNADGGAETRLTDGATVQDEEPSWSRDGTMIAFRSNRAPCCQIWSMDSGGNGLTPLTDTTPDSDNLNPVWSPVVDRIAFASSRDGDYEIYSMDADGGNVVQHTSNTAFDSNPDWSPDGTKLAFQSNVDGNFDVLVLDIASGVLRQRTNEPAFDSAPTWSPDGTKLAFQSNRDGDFEIYTMNPDGTGVVRLTENEATDRVADWQPVVAGAPLAITCPSNMSVSATTPAGAVVTYAAIATGGVGGITINYAPPSGSTLAIGTHTVTATASDSGSNTASCSFTVTVNDAFRAVTPTDGGLAPGTTITINDTSGDQYEPHVSGDLAAYTELSATAARIRYYDFATALDGIVPSGAAGDIDSGSSVSGSRIAFHRTAVPSGQSSVVVYDVATGTSIEFDPPATYSPSSTAIAGDTVAFHDFALDNRGDIAVADVDDPTAPLRYLSASPAFDLHPQLAPDGNTVVWESCASFNCDVYRAIRTGGTWGPAQPVSAPSTSHELNPVTDGAEIVYDSDRPSATGQDIYFQPVGGGVETQLSLDGFQRWPRISDGVVSFESKDTLDTSTTPADLFVYVIATNTLYRVTDTPTVHETMNDIDVLPNGDVRLVWAAYDGPPGERNIYARTFTVPLTADPTPPEITCPTDMSVNATAPEGAAVTYEATATGGVGGIEITYSPLSGSTLAIGTQTVTATATDSADNTASCTFTVTVIGAAAQVEQTQAMLAALAGPSGTPLSDKVEDALDKLDTANQELAEQPSDRQAALGALEGAAGDIEAAVKDGLLTAGQATPILEELSAAARLLALTGIDEAIARGGDAAKIAQAQQALAAGDGKRSAGAYKDAISLYRNALATAESA